MASGCPVISGTDPAVAQVYTIQDRVLQFGSQAFGIATQQVAALNAFQITPYNFSVNFDVDGELTAYHRPPTVGDPNITYNPKVKFPSKPTVQWPNALSPGPVPTFSAATPSISIPAPPTMVVPVAPDAPLLTEPLIPGAPIVVLPLVPTLRGITLPIEPTIAIPTFTGIAPVRNFGVPNFDFDFSPATYASALLDQTRARVSLMMQGGTGLPLAIEQALFDRAAAREDVTDLKAMMEAEERVSSRGFTEPNGILDRRLSEISFRNRSARAGINRDNLIDMRKIEIENLRFAVEKGIALEQVSQDLFFKQQQLLLDSLKFRAELQTKTLDARIAISNLDATIYQAQAAVYRDLIQAELSKLEVYKTQLEARRLISDLNQQDIALYIAKLDGVEKIIEIFRAEIEAANAITANNNARVQEFIGLNQARSESIRAIGYEFDAYKTQVEAENVKASIFETLGRNFASLTQAYATVESTKLEQGRFGIAKGQAILDQWSRESQNVVEELKAEALTVTTKLDVFRGLLDRMKTESEIERSASDSNTRMFELALRKAETDVQTQLKSVDLSIDQNEKIKSILLEAMRTAATVGAQLAGSSLSALSTSASIGSTHSQSSGCSTSYSFAGSLDDQS